ncbi:MAG: xanthine phosphoribosyltransferase [Clostridia bacterium]|nr:xanthine phosphoribosyltransferase [Clostridia bacterium]
MRLLEQKILTDGVVLPGHILKVNSFLNQQVDVGLLMELGKEIKSTFEKDGVNKILTLEASGIAIAAAFAAVMDVPMVFAKKSSAKNLSGDILTQTVHSYTHNKDYDIVVEKRFLGKGDRVLIVDDFLANGAALSGLINMVNESGAELVACVPAIEKGFQGGGDSLREKGIRVESLAIVESMDDEGNITFRK